MIEQVAAGGGRGSGVGCSRKLAESDQPECADNQMYCWMRCMNFTEEVNPDACAEQGLGLQCLSQRLEIWRPQDSHGDYNPTCTDVTDQYVTPPPMIPARAESCDGTFDEFLAKDEYENALELEEGKHWLLWTVKPDGTLEAKQAYDDTVGWLAIGPQNPGGKKNGMAGARIVMGIVDTDSPDDPDVFGSPWIGTSVKEYIIHDDLSAFRHWSTPVEPSNLESAEIISTACHTAIKFSTKNIAGWDLNLTDDGSVATMIWGSHVDTYLKGYHTARGHVNISATGGSSSDSGGRASTGTPLAGMLFSLLLVVPALLLLH